MPLLNNHGGGCCGMRHIAGFGGIPTDVTDIDNILRRNVENGKNVEIVLAQYQVESDSFRPILDKMAQVGFVLVGIYSNSGSGNFNYVFHRADRRQPLTQIGDRWTGQYMTPGLSGDLTSGLASVTEWNREQRHQNPDFELPMPRFREQVAPPAPPPPVPNVRLLVTTYHNVYRDGRVGAGYDSLDDARNARRGDGLVRAKVLRLVNNRVVTEWNDQ